MIFIQFFWRLLYKHGVGVRKQEEDDGVVLAAVTAANGSSFLLVLDAATFKELARCKLPCALPYGFHGQWIPPAASP